MLPEEHNDSWWYRVYAVALLFTALVIAALWLFERVFSS
jgi:cbb3-type cytochrome oxidase subunit 1